MVADSTATTHQMRHIMIRDFALQDWTEKNCIALTVCASNTNASDFVCTTTITFPAGPHYFGLILALLLVPDMRLEPRGLSVFPANRPYFPQPHSKSIA
jgi:hypothetical protein